MGNLVILDYIRSSIDILLNLKIEDAMLEHGQNIQQSHFDAYINSSRGGHGALSNIDNGDS